MSQPTKRAGRIAGTLLSCYRIRAGLSQPSLAESIGDDFTKLQQAERGFQSAKFITSHIGAIAQWCKLTGPETLNLLGACWADEFLANVLRGRKKQADASAYRLRLFESMLLDAQPSARHWVRIAFGSNRIPTDYCVVRNPIDAEDQTRLATNLRKPLIVKLVLEELRAVMYAACTDADNLALEKSDERMSQLRLFYARSIARLGEADPRRVELRQTLERVFESAAGRPVLRRQAAYALGELGYDAAMCRYLRELDASDATRNLRNLEQRTADSGEGAETLGMLIQLLQGDSSARSTPRVALDLHTISQALAPRGPNPEREWVPALENLASTRNLVALVTPFAKQESHPEWCQAHVCKGACRDLAARHAGAILERVASFYATLPLHLSVDA